MIEIPPNGSVVWMRASSRSLRATLIAVVAGDLVHLRFDDDAFNCDGRHGRCKPYRALRTAVFAAALERVEAADD